MTNQRFKDLLFQILNENDTFISDIELNDSENYFLINCIDGSKFSLFIQESITRFVLDSVPNKSSAHQQSDPYIKTYSKNDFFSEIEWLAHNNPYVFQILVVVLKLSELHIISEEMAQKIMTQILPYAQDLKEEWENLH